MRSIRATACLALVVALAMVVPPHPAAAQTAVPDGDGVLPPDPAREIAIPRAFRSSDRVVASWYGPGFYGNRTACGQVLTTALLGAAHRTLPCGTPVTLRYGSSTVTVPVVDRGPQVYSRELDLTYATKVALGCPDLCWVDLLR